MDKDAPLIEANRTGDGIITSFVRSKSSIFTLLVGFALGMLGGILNLYAADNGWKLTEDFFNRMDAPIYLLITSPHHSIGSLMSTNEIRDSCLVRALLACYWGGMGLFLALLVCRRRTGVIKDTAREKICG